jgi:hypothetical protein
MSNGVLDHVYIHSDNILDVKEAGWPGDVYSAYVTTSDSVQRFHATSLRFKDVKIYNAHSAQYAYIGKYNSNAGTFSGYALIMAPYETKDFEYVDLYELGFRHFTGAPNFTLRVLGLNEY